MRDSSAAARRSRASGEPIRSSTRLEEAAHDHPLRRDPVKAARHQVEELGAVDLADRGAVRAAHVVGLDLEPRDRGRLGVGREQQVAVLLVGVGLLRALVDADDPAPDGPGAVVEHALERQVGSRVGGGVLLGGVVVDVLGPGQVVRAGHLDVGALAGEQALHARLGPRAAEGRGHPVELGIPADRRPVGAELAGLGVVVLDGDVLEPGLVGDHQLDDDVQVAGHLRAELLDERCVGAALEHDQHAVVQGGALARSARPATAAAPRPSRRRARAGARRRASGRRLRPRTSRSPARPCPDTARRAPGGTRPPAPGS